MSEVLVEARGVAKRFARRPVLRDVGFSVQRGELVGIVGENGCGKTTLLKILVGLLAADAGRVLVGARFGYCPQEPLVFDSLTAREHFRYFAAAYGALRWEEAAEELLERLAFRTYADAPVERVSGGTRQKLNLALALLHSPDLLVLDEPYSGFDWETYQRFWDLADELRGRGRGLLIVSHLVHDRARFDAVHVLAEGVLRCT